MLREYEEEAVRQVTLYVDNALRDGEQRDPAAETIMLDLAAQLRAVCEHVPGARELFLIKSGQVEVWQERRMDRPEKLLTKLGPKDIFGERAMLNQAKYNSSVRTVTAVDVLALSREEFNAIMDQFQVLKDHYKATQPEIFEKAAKK